MEEKKTFLTHIPHLKVEMTILENIFGGNSLQFMNEKGNFLEKFHYHLECLMSPRTAVYYLTDSVVGIL